MVYKSIYSTPKKYDKLSPHIYIIDEYFKKSNAYDIIK